MNINKVKSLLNTDIIGKEILFYNEITSTNEILYQLGESGNFQNGTTIIADQQLNGKGRLGRSWFSPPGLNLYLSVILKPKIDLTESSVFTFIASLALYETINEYGVDTDVKWPNDILISKKKIAGVLTEMKSSSNRVDFIIIGVGINLNVDKKTLGEALQEVSKNTTSLMIETKEIVDREVFTAKLIENLDNFYNFFKFEGVDSIIARWLGKWSYLNKRIKVNVNGDIVEGIARKVDNKGFLYIEKEGGNLEKIIAGDMIVKG